MSPRRSLLIAALAAGCATPHGAQTPPPSAPRDLFLFIYRPGPAWRPGVPMREQGLGPHGAYMQRLLDEGRLVAAGGFVDADGGMAVLRCADIAEARALLVADPAIASRIFTADLRHWRPRFHADAPLLARE